MQADQGYASDKRPVKPSLPRSFVVTRYYERRSCVKHRDRAEPTLGRRCHRIPCGEGVFWLAAVRDAFSRRIVGWKTSDRCDTDLILAALEYGIWSRDVRDGQFIHHSDRGSNGFNGPV
ncbi:DDE-type integrase/transposase/recombinase [Micromonospora sp. NPDC049460]|uniref:DDE-type integrase/transposase/recombinase n=1 Tax=unclassified Micromonospora TaxID=2617518 RepID=UPI00371B7593